MEGVRPSPGVGTGKMDVRMRIRSRAVLRDYIGLVATSERAVARTAGVSHSTLNHLLTGRRVTCTQPIADAIERALGCAPGVFFERA